MFWAILCVGVLLALASSLHGRRFWYICATSVSNMLKSPSSRAHSQLIHRVSAAPNCDIVDGWRTLQLWKRDEQRRNLCDSPLSSRESNPLDSASNIGLPQSVAVSKSDFRLGFTRGSAAVLVGLFQNDTGQIRVILTKRAEALSSHSGEVALPGGKRDKEDADDVATALREAKEEIGLDPTLVKVLTTVEPFVSKKLLRVTPVIGLIVDKAKFKPIPNAGEVDVIFDVPLEMFLKDQGHRYEERKWFGFTYRLHFFEFNKENNKFIIWGLTAAILIRCALIIYKRSPSFEEVEVLNKADRFPRL